MSVDELYFSSTLMWGASADDMIDYAVAQGYAGLEVWVEQFSEDESFCSTVFNTHLRAAGLHCHVHAKSWDLNYASINPAIRTASLEQIRQSLRFAQALQAQSMTLHPPRASFAGRESFFQALMTTNLRQLNNEAKALDVLLSLEIMEPIAKELVVFPEQVSRLLAAIPDLHLTLDLAHCRDEAQIGEFIATFPSISKFHISNRQGNRYHTALAQGDHDFSRLLPLLMTKSLPIVIEGFDEHPDHELLNANTQFIHSLKENIDEKI